MDHQVKQLLHLGLEAQGFFLSFHTHALLLHVVDEAAVRRMSYRWGHVVRFQVFGLRLKQLDAGNLFRLQAETDFTLPAHALAQSDPTVLIDTLKATLGTLARGNPRLQSQGIWFCGSSQGRCRRRCLRSEEHTSELQSQFHLVCRLLLEKK